MKKPVAKAAIEDDEEDDEEESVQATAMASQKLAGAVAKPGDTQ